MNVLILELTFHGSSAYMNDHVDFELMWRQTYEFDGDLLVVQ